MPLITTAARCLEETVRSGSIRKAAQALYLSASAVNRHILNLEVEYGGPLLERLPRGVVPTEAGRLLVARIRDWRLELAETVKQLDQLRGTKRLHISVGLNECIAANVLPIVLADVRRTSPDVVMSVVVGGSEELAASLVAGRFDMIVAFDLPRSTDFWSVSSLEVPVGVVVAADDPLGQQSSVALADCVDRRIILVDDSLTLRPVLDAILDSTPAGPVFPVISNSIQVIKNAVRDGMGISLLTLFDIMPEWQEGRLKYVPLREPVTETLSIGIRGGRKTPPAVIDLCSLFDRVLRDLSSKISSERTLPEAPI